MLNSKLLFILIAIHSALPMKKYTKLGKKPPFPKQANCETMKCPAVEQPLCAKLVYKNAGNKTVHVVMVNKCEMNYVKCHKGLDAAVVSMKSCDHNNFIKSGNKRSKREVVKEDGIPLENMPDIQHMILQVDEKRQLQKMEEQALKGTHDFEYKSGANIVVLKGTKSGMSSPDIKKNYDIDEYNTDVNGVDERDDDADEDDDEFKDEDDGEHQDGDEENEYKGDQDYNEEEPESDEHNYEASDNENSEKNQTLIGVDVDLTDDIKDTNLNTEEYNSDCPTVCPSRDVMVCARCSHGVLRTFLSVCHMRMFACRHTDESLDLIARLPCVMSGPYLSDASMQPTGRLREPNDDDRVLRYLRCRELSKTSREGDPRCKYMNDQDMKIMVETFKVDDDY